MRKSSSFAVLIFIIIFGIGLVIAFTAYKVMANTESVLIGAVAFIIALFVSLSVKVADQWERVVILRLGKFRSLKGPGLFLIIPVIDNNPTGLIPE
jgi:regulator of protease activity HflC (stomatin/prohibitin superfamily)